MKDQISQHIKQWVKLQFFYILIFALIETVLDSKDVELNDDEHFSHLFCSLFHHEYRSVCYCRSKNMNFTTFSDYFSIIVWFRSVFEWRDMNLHAYLISSAFACSIHTEWDPCHHSMSLHGFLWKRKEPQ